MAKKELTIKLTLEYDPSENDGKPEHIFLFQFLTRLNRKHKIIEVDYKGIKRTYKNKEDDINKIPLRKVDSISEMDLPKEPEWLKDKTVLPPRPKKIIKQ